MVYIINGKGRAGKDFFIDAVQFFMGDYFCKKISTIDPIKRLAIDAGWNGIKDNQSRRHLSELKNLLIGWLDTPFIYAEREYAEFMRRCSNYDIDIEDTAFFIICREPNEIQRLKERFNGKTILVHRKETDEIVYGNPSDDEVNCYEYDIEIANNGTREEFVEVAQKFIKKEGLHFSEKNYIINILGEIEEQKNDN